MSARPGGSRLEAVSARPASSLLQAVSAPSGSSRLEAVSARPGSSLLQAMSARAGSSLLEAVIALACGLIVCTAAAGILRSEQELAVVRGRRLARAETLRVAESVLRRELATAEGAQDVAGAAADTVALRLFRGLAVTCGAAGERPLAVRYLGERLPDPAKDSLLPIPPADVSTGEGVALPLPLRGVAAGAGDDCPGPGQPLLLALDTNLPPGTPMLVFERGTYALSGSALRLRRGGEGRQPLTPEWLDTRRSSLALVMAPAPLSPAAAATPPLPPMPAALDVVLALQGTSRGRRLRVPLLNAAAPASAAAPQP